MTHSWGEYHRGCRCDFCMQRRLRADKHRLMYGHNLVDAAPVQSLLAQLTAEGFTGDSIAAATGISRTNLVELPHRKRVYRSTENSFRALTRRRLIAATPDEGEVPAVGVYRRVRALLRLGWTRQSIGRTPSEWATLRAVLDGRQHRVKAGFHRYIQALYDQRSMTLGPHKGNRSRFTREGYPPPLAWDDDSIDDPRVRPLTGDLADRISAFVEDAIEMWERGVDPERILRKLDTSPAAAAKRFHRRRPEHPLTTVFNRLDRAARRVA